MHVLRHMVLREGIRSRDSKSVAVRDGSMELLYAYRHKHIKRTVTNHGLWFNHRLRVDSGIEAIVNVQANLRDEVQALLDADIKK